MNKEEIKIKEFDKQQLELLLNDLQDIDKFTGFKDGAFKYELGKYQANLLVNCIKKQKEENEFLKSEIEEAKRIVQKYLEYIDERDERINKAIEYIEYNNETLYTYEPDYDYEENMVDNYDISSFREDLLKILKEVK